MQARQLIVETFESIKVYHHGFRPASATKGTIGLRLLAKGGVERELLIPA